jgi:hypothetical protein
MYSENSKMTRLKLISGLVTNPNFHKIYLIKYNEPIPEIFTKLVSCYAPNNQNSIKREREVTPCLDKERIMNVKPLRGETSFTIEQMYKMR